MSDIQMDCYGSVILHSDEDPYCARCPLLAACKTQVESNRKELQQALGRPVFEAQGKYWANDAVVSRQRRAFAAALSSPVTVKPEPPAVSPPVAAPRPAPVTVLDGTTRTPFDAQSQPGLQKKVAERLQVWVTKGVDPSLIVGGNPFAHLHGCSIDNLIAIAFNARGQMTKRELKEELIAMQSAAGGSPWSDASLQSNINIVCGAFKACGYDLLKERT